MHGICEIKALLIFMSRSQVSLFLAYSIFNIIKKILKKLFKIHTYIKNSMKEFKMSLFSFRQALPDYVVINDPKSKNKDVLRAVTEDVKFPLDEETLQVIAHLQAKYDGEENCAGLAAPQIGYSKRILILEVPDDEELKKFRTDLTDTLPKSVWINPSFTPLTEEKTLDWEACFSVDNLAGKVSRYTEVAYEAWTPEGNRIQGKAKGFLARLIQHEIDHLNGFLFIDHVPEEELVSRDEQRKRRDEDF